MAFNYDLPIDKEAYAKMRKIYDLFATPLGEEVLDEMIETYELRISATQFEEGQRSVILEIRRILNGIKRNLFKILE